MFLAIDRVSKFAHVAFYDANAKMNGAAFLREVVATFPYAIHTVLTDNGMAFADLPKYRDGPTARWMGTSSTGSAASTASSTSSPSPTTPGPTAKPSG